MENKKWYVLDKEEVAYFYQLDETGKPVLKANWMIGSLGLVNAKEWLEKAIKHNNEFLIALYTDLLNMDISKLDIVSEKMNDILNQLDPNGKAFWGMEGELDDPQPYEEPYGDLEIS